VSISLFYIKQVSLFGEAVDFTLSLFPSFEGFFNFPDLKSSTDSINRLDKLKKMFVLKDY